MAEIKLGNGGVALVDDDIFEDTNQFNWTLNKQTGYAYRRFYDDMGKYVCEYMHRRIVRASKGSYVDHKNRNKLDNRASNLRLCSQDCNIANAKLAVNNTSGYRGVTKVKRGWLSQLTHMGKNLYLGVHDTAEHAADAYDKKAYEIFGEFAYQNNAGRV